LEDEERRQRLGLVKINWHCLFLIF
jgi:hypothetical protein